MRHTIDEQLMDEIQRHRLRFTCEDCAHFMGIRAGCAHGWPNAEHALAPDEHSIGKELVFCKEFDLG
jgi:hypothetical protein